jgi:glycosyl transferase-like sugar-binding protein
MGSWGKLYPRFDLRRFDDARARAFLARFHTAEVQAAYHRSRQPAQKADIFRLAYLYAQGGYWADADDRLVGDLEELRFPGAGLVLYQEDIGTIGNNFIGAVPGHPLVGRALRSAVEAINRGDNDILWLSTGPGMLTRAFADLLADPGREPLAALDDAVVLGHGELQRAVSIHCLVGYKNTERHWSRTAFGRRAAAAAGRSAPLPAANPGAGRSAGGPAAAAQGPA